MSKSATPKAVADAAALAAAALRYDGSPMPAELPATVTLASPYGFLDDDGVPNWWQAGQVVDDADDIRVLIERRAPLVETIEA